jgi:predicted N-acetyltransferase YhbS
MVKVKENFVLVNGGYDMEISIRQEEEKDFEMVYEINKLAFGQENESKLVENIRKGENFVPELSLVAESDGEVVGHILFSKIKLVGEGEFESLALAPMAVVPKLQKQGIGGKLVNAGLEIAQKLGFESVIVVGYHEYYPRFGFVKASKWGIKCPFEVPDEAFMAVELVKDSLKGKAGMVQYPKEFMEE